MNGRISTRSSEPYADLPATIITDVPEGYDNGIILPPAFKGPNQPFYLTADPANLNVSNTLAVGGEINLNGGILTVADGSLELDGVPIGGSSTSTGSFTTITASTLGGALNINNQVLTNANIDSGYIDSTQIGITTPAQARFTTLSASSTLHYISFKTTKCVVPTVTTYNPGASNAQVRNTSIAADCSSTAAANESDSGFRITATSAAGSAAGQTNLVHWTADAEL